MSNTKARRRPRYLGIKQAAVPIGLFPIDRKMTCETRSWADTPENRANLRSGVPVFPNIEYRPSGCADVDAAPPQVANSFPDLEFNGAQVRTITVPASTFTGNGLTYTATRGDLSPLPDGVIFDGATRTYTLSADLKDEWLILRTVATNTLGVAADIFAVHLLHNASGSTTPGGGAPGVVQGVVIPRKSGDQSILSLSAAVITKSDGSKWFVLTNNAPADNTLLFWCGTGDRRPWSTFQKEYPCGFPLAVSCGRDPASPGMDGRPHTVQLLTSF